MVSLVIPVRNEERYIWSCLSQILGQTYPKDQLEILVIDGMSTDRTRRIVRAFEAAMGDDRGERLEIRVLDNPKVQRAPALNAGIRAAKGDIILRLDARTVIPPHYIEGCVRTLLDMGADNVGGVLKPISATLTQEAIGLAMSHPFGAGNARFRLGRRSGDVDTVYLGCFRREVFDRVGLFDENAPIISEDSDMNQRIREAGGRVYLNHEIVVHFYPRESFRAFWRLYFRYGGARAGNLLKHRKFTVWRQWGPPAFLLSVGVSVALAPLDSRFGMVGLALVGAFLIADLAVSAYQAFTRRKWGLFSRLFVAYLCLHGAYGLGFFRRLLQRPRPGEYWPN